MNDSMRQRRLLVCASLTAIALLSCAKPDPAPAQLAAQHEEVRDAVEDVYIWGALGSLDTAPENRVIEAVEDRIRQRLATREDMQAAYEAQVAKRKHLAELFDKQEILRQVANEQSRLAQSIRDIEIRKAALKVADNAQQFLAASDEWRKLQTKKGEWNEALFEALRDETTPPSVEVANQLNRELGNAVQAIERLRTQRQIVFAEYQGVVTRRAAT
jgi:hypothetical protein